MRVTAPAFTFEELTVGMVVNIFDHNRKKLMRATIIRLHKVRTERFALGDEPVNSRRGGCDFATYGGETVASLRTYSVDGEPLGEDCNYSVGCCIHVRYQNNSKAVVGLWSIRPVNPLTLLAEQAKTGGVE